jgi:hypothetical protein
MRVGECFLAVELVVQVILVIAGDQKQMVMGERLAVLPAEDANGDWLVVDDREGLIRAANGSGQQGYSGGKRECEWSDHELHLTNLSAQRAISRVF